MEQEKGGRKGLGCSLKHKQPWIQQPHGPSYRIQKAAAETSKETKMMHMLQSQSTGKLLLQEFPAQNTGFLHLPTHEHPRWRLVTWRLLCHTLRSDLVKMLLIETHRNTEYFRCAIMYTRTFYI